ncbi:hypothetical protein D3C80_1740760 [compost metagenome]
MRCDQGDIPDRTALGDGYGYQSRTHSQNKNAYTQHLNPQPCGCLISQLQQIKCAGKHKSNTECDKGPRQHRQDMIPAAVSQRTKQIGVEQVHVITRRQCDQNNEQSIQNSRHRHAD